MSTCIVAKLNLIIYEGGTFDKTLQWFIGDPTVAVDLTGFDAKMTIRHRLADAVPLLSLPLVEIAWAPDGTSGIYLSDPANGKYQIYIKDEDSIGLCAENKDIDGVYDLFLYNAVGEAVLKVYGSVKLVAAVTR